jgi:hypothetical protein
MKTLILGLFKLVHKEKECFQEYYNNPKFTLMPEPE